MNVKHYIPTPERLSVELIAVLAATIGAAWIISKFPALRQFVFENSVTVRDGDGGPFLGD